MHSKENNKFVFEFEFQVFENVYKRHKPLVATLNPSIGRRRRRLMYLKFYCTSSDKHSQTITLHTYVALHALPIYKPFINPTIHIMNTLICYLCTKFSIHFQLWRYLRTRFNCLLWKENCFHFYSRRGFHCKFFRF